MKRRMNFVALLVRRDWRDDVSAYVDDELNPRDRRRVEARLAQSGEMRDYLADLQEMRSVLRGFASSPAGAPFQLTPEMLEQSSRVELQGASPARALRFSMATAAAGVAAFAAVMVFDAVDSPSVTFTTTQAGDMSRSVPTAAVITEEVELESQSVASAVSTAQADRSSGGEPPAAAAEEQMEEEQASVAAFEQEQQQAAEEAMEAQQEAEQEHEAQQQAEEQEWQEEPVEQGQEQVDDPSRRAITAGRGSGESDAEDVTAERVVAKEEQETVEATAEDSQRSEEAGAAAASAEDADSEPPAAASATEEQIDETSDGDPQPQSERRTVARSVRHLESDWPLEQRARSTSVRLATDPSWERPVQIVLAAFAVAATSFWLTLTIVDRRRRT